MDPTTKKQFERARAEVLFAKKKMEENRDGSRRLELMEKLVLEEARLLLFVSSLAEETEGKVGR